MDRRRRRQRRPKIARPSISRPSRRQKSKRLPAGRRTENELSLNKRNGTRRNENLKLETRRPPPTLYPSSPAWFRSRAHWRPQPSPLLLQTHPAAPDTSSPAPSSLQHCSGKSGWYLKHLSPNISQSDPDHCPPLPEKVPEVCKSRPRQKY